MSYLKDKVILVTGATKGFGREFALKAAEQGANIALVSKVVHQNASNMDSIFTMSEKIKALGGDAIAIQTDIRYDDQVQRAIDQTVEKYGQIDACVNAASVNPNNESNPFDMVAYDLFHQINVRSAILVSSLAKKALQGSDNPHILFLSPRHEDMTKQNLTNFSYGLTRLSMTNLVHLLSKSLVQEGIAVNGIWPKGPIDQFENEFFAYAEPNEEPMSIKLMADAAIKILQQPADSFTGRVCLDKDILIDSGCTTFDEYYPEQVCVDVE